MDKCCAHKAARRACQVASVRHVWTRYGHPLKGWDMVGVGWDVGVGVGLVVHENESKLVGGRTGVPENKSKVVGWRTN